MRASRPHTPRQVRVTCTPATRFAVFKEVVICVSSLLVFTLNIIFFNYFYFTLLTLIYNGCYNY